MVFATTTYYCVLFDVLRPLLLLGRITVPDVSVLTRKDGRLLDANSDSDRCDVNNEKIEVWPCCIFGEEEEMCGL